MPDQDQSQLQERANKLAWDFIENHGITSMIFGTTYDLKGHKWVRSEDCEKYPAGEMYFCPWCGVHRIEVANWKEDPPCPAIADAFELRSAASFMERFREGIKSIIEYKMKEGEAGGSASRKDSLP